MLYNKRNRLITVPAFFAVLLMTSCSSNSNDKKKKEDEPAPQTADNKYREDDTGDSIVYFKDFDLYTFQGKEQVKAEDISVPFVKLVYKGEQMTMTAYYTNGTNHSVDFIKLNGYWTVHSWHKGEGVMSHFYTMYTDKGAFEFKFHSDPYMTEQARFYSITFWQTINNNLQLRYYQSFDWAAAVDFDSVPPPSGIREAEIKKAAETSMVTDYFVTADSVGYTLSSSGKRQMMTRLLEQSFFYSMFRRLKDGNLGKL
jgi:hypothetical protein